MLDGLPRVLCSHRAARTARVDLIVIHTNEGPEGPASAENVARWLQRPDVTPGYHVVGDENSRVVGCEANQRCNGAGGVNDRAWHYCVTGYAAQSLEQWNDASSRAALVLAAATCREVGPLLGVPLRRITDPRGSRGICGHADVSRYHRESDGHYDPGPHFPWETFMAMVTNGQPSPEQIAAYLRLLEELDVEHGMAADTVCAAGDRLITLDRWGGLHTSNGVRLEGGGSWGGQDVARKIVLRNDALVDPNAPLTGWIQDLNGGLHPFAEAGVPLPPKRRTAYWPGGKIVAINEL